MPKIWNNNAYTVVKVLIFPKNDNTAVNAMPATAKIMYIISITIVRFLILLAAVTAPKSPQIELEYEAWAEVLS